ncbi:MAG: tyrosine-type recombinase/integrase [Alistipes sp.]|nr:tyrosine-type recombinase/integrase [Alistipes sp.]
MSLKGSSTRADYIEWNTAVNLVHRLYRDGDYRMSLLIGCGIFFGLRISDILQLSWDMLLDGDSFTLTEQKTGKRRTVRINRDFKKHIKACHKAMRVINNTSKCFINATRAPLSIQRVNVLLKQIKTKYGLKTVRNISSHSLRKTFGRKVFESAGENANMALVRLSELFNHSNVAITKIYLGIRQEELLETYDLLDF